MALMTNHYRCDECGAEWTDEWSCACNDRCPSCNAETEPHDSEDILVDLEVTTSRFYGGTDKTDHHVLWVSVPAGQVQTYTATLKARWNVQVEEIDLYPSAEDIDFVFPEDCDKFDERMAELMNEAPVALGDDPFDLLVEAERFIAGFEDDEAQYGVRDLLARIRKHTGG